MKSTLLLLFVLVAGPASAAKLPDGWLTDFSKGLEKAKAEGKPVMAVFSAVWCGPCQEMIQEVYPSPEVRAELSKWVPVYVDVDEDTKTPAKFKITGYPTFVLLSPEGKEEDRQVGGRPEASFLRMLRNHQIYVAKAAELEARFKAAPDDPVAWKEKAENEMLKDHAEEAQAAYEKVAKLDPGNKLETADDLEYLKAIPSKYADLKLSAERLAAIETKYPTSGILSKVRVARVMVALRQDDLDGAKALLEDGIKKFASSDEADDMKTILARLNAFLEDRAEAEKEKSGAK